MTPLPRWTAAALRSGQREDLAAQVRMAPAGCSPQCLGRHRTKGRCHGSDSRTMDPTLGPGPRSRSTGGPRNAGTPKPSTPSTPRTRSWTPRSQMSGSGAARRSPRNVAATRPTDTSPSSGSPAVRICGCPGISGIHLTDESPSSGRRPRRPPPRDEVARCPCGGGCRPPAVALFAGM